MICSFATLKANQEYYYIRVESSEPAFDELLSTLDLEAAIIKSGVYFQTFINSEEKAYLDNHKIRYTLLANPEKLKQVNKANTLAETKYFKLGSIDGFYTYKEIISFWDNLILKFPTLIKRDTIGYSIENRPILAYKLSTNYSIANNNRVLYTALHHAREPLGLTTLYYFIADLLEKYENKDNEAIYLLQNRVLHFVPCLNPDSYLANEQTKGLTRKNARRINDTIFGVDLNRNYGTFEMWNSSKGGSSPLRTHETYRGTEPFSEPETKAIRDYCLYYQFATALNYHSFGNLIIHPWELFQMNEDKYFFQRFSLNSTWENNYVYGWDVRSIGYISRGNSDEWMYSQDAGKNRILSFTPEIGSSDGKLFWNYSQDEIITYGKENLKLNYNAAWSAGYNPSAMFVDYDCEKQELKLTISNIGVSPITSKDSIRIEISPVEKEKIRNDLSFSFIQTEKSDTTFIFPIQFSQEAKNGEQLEWVFNVIRDGKILKSEKFTTKAGICSKEWIYNPENPINNYTTNTWGLEKDTISNLNILTDSPYSNYNSVFTSYVEFNKSYKVNPDTIYNLSLDLRYNIERNFDFAYCAAYYNGQWNPVQFPRTTQGKKIFNSQQTAQIDDFWGFAGHVYEWTTQKSDFTYLLGKDIKFKFEIKSDQSNNYEGLYIKNFYIEKYPKDTNLSISYDNDIKHISYKNILSLTEKSRIVLYDISGRNLEEQNETDFLNYNKYEQGVYFALVFQGSKTKIVKLIRD
jgi:hypothetical protein